MSGDRKAEWEDRAAHWSPADITEDVPVRQGRPPRMTVWPWTRWDRGTEVGRNEDGAWWRYRDRDCKRFTGPYRTPQSAEEVPVNDEPGILSPAMAPYETLALARRLERGAARAYEHARPVWPGTEYERRLAAARDVDETFRQVQRDQIVLRHRRPAEGPEEMKSRIARKALTARVTGTVSEPGTGMELA